MVVTLPFVLTSLLAIITFRVGLSRDNVHSAYINGVYVSSMKGGVPSDAITDHDLVARYSERSLVSTTYRGACSRGDVCLMRCIKRDSREGRIGRGVSEGGLGGELGPRVCTPGKNV